MEQGSQSAQDMASMLPLLIYDGDCGFCYYWVKYWQALTGDKVHYAPYQQVEQAFPAIPQEEFQRAVQYVDTDKVISSGAKASFQVVSQAEGGGVWLWCYRYVPFFGILSEKAYHLISTHREFFYRICLIVYGHHYLPPRYDVISWIYLRCLGLIYCSAFISFGVQALGLIGSHGIIPVADLKITYFGVLSDFAYWVLPMVFWLNSSDFFIQAVCWCGALSSLLLVFDIYPRANLIILYLLYLSLVSAGQVFMTYQWDTFLLEAGMIALFLIRYRTVAIWLLRFLLFRFMLAGGLVKILSGDPSWPAFTALYKYFETEPIPTPLAWYAHHLPHFLLSCGAAVTLVIELALPFLIFFPRRIRFFVAFSTLFFQSFIILTGNYNFFNLETISLCIVLFDDAAVRAILPRRLIPAMTEKVNAKPHSKRANRAMIAYVAITIFLSLVQFHERFIGRVPYAFAWVNDVLAPFHIVGTYGPFAVITYPRYEILIEGSNDGNHWQEYEFKYKPGDVNRSLGYNIPHQPRLDWQMWFAALSRPEDNPWFQNFMTRLLENSSSVLLLLKTNPFPKHAPLFVRAEFYQYRFSTPEERQQTGAIWVREPVGMYFPQARLKSIFDRGE